MDRETRRLVEEFRRKDAGPIENNLIDELVGGELDRQEFLRRATVFGLGAGTIGLLLRYVGEADPAFGAPSRRRSAGRSGSACSDSARASSRISSGRPARWAWRGIPGEYLTFSNPALQVKPWLATSWKPNGRDRLDVPLRKGVKFENGQTMTAEDVVATFKQYLSAERVAGPRLRFGRASFSPDGV